MLAGATARAELRFAQPTADLGEVKSGPRLSQRFSFVNAGPDPVDILDLRTTCGCLKPQLTQRTYPPGEQGTLLLEVNTLSQPPGEHDWPLQVMYRLGTDVKETTLHLKARLVTEVSVQPAAMTIFAGSGLTHEMTVTDSRPKPFTVTAVQTTSPQLRADLAEAGRDAQGRWTRRIQLVLADDFPQGRHEATVSIFTDDPAYRELLVPVTIVKRPRQSVLAQPAEVTLTAVAGQPLPSRIVQVHAGDDRPVVVERVTADDDALRCQWVQGPGNRATVKVSADRQRMAGRVLKSAIHIHVRQPVRETVTIPVSCILP
jgi:hypothetical protein